MNLHAIGIDLGKTTFHLVGLNQAGEVQVRKKFSRSQLLRFTANVQVQMIGMEACAGSHFLGKALREQGHEARPIPAQYVKPFVKTNKSDFIDAEAIAEVVSRPSMRFVPIKTDEQLDMQSLHRVRERWIMRRTSVVNQIRGLLLERGITVRTGRCHLDAALPTILEDGSKSLSGTLRFLLVELKQELEQLAEHIEQAEMLIQRAAQKREACQRLDAIPGIGPLTATALIAAIGNGGAFRKGREFAAWVGLVPREHSTGGKQKLLGISKRSNSYLRRLFVKGARAVLRYRDKQCSGLKHWLTELSSRICASIDTLSCNSEWVALEKIIAKVTATNATIPKQTVRILVWRMVNAGELVKKFAPFGRKDAYEVKRTIRALDHQAAVCTCPDSL